MNDQQVLQFIRTVRPDMASYFQQMNPGGDDAAMVNWAKQHFSEGHDKQQFDDWVTSQGNTGGLPNTPAPGGGFQNLVTPTAPAVPNTQVPQASTGGLQGNYNQVQNANQAGQFVTTGASSGQETQNTTQSGTQNTTGSTNTTQSSTSTTNVTDPHGFGGMLAGQAEGAAASDANRTKFLTDVMQTGGTGFASQMDQAIRQSLTGPQTTGAGDSARARMASYGAAEVGRTNMNQRLAAADQLKAPGALTEIAKAGQGFTGTSTTNEGTSSTDQLLNQVTNSKGFSDLVSKGQETSAGSTAGASSQAGSGTIPQGQPVKTGGCIVCTVGIEHGHFKNVRVLRKVVQHKTQRDYPRFREAIEGYFYLFGWFARLLLRRPTLSYLVRPITRSIVYEELRIAGRRLPFRVRPWLYHWSWHLLCTAVGKLRKNPVRGLTDPVLISVAKKHDVLFTLNEETK